jgi:hypothetical protein
VVDPPTDSANDRHRPEGPAGRSHAHVASGTDVAQPFVELSSRIQTQNRA